MPRHRLSQIMCLHLRELTLGRGAIPYESPTYLSLFERARPSVSSTTRNYGCVCLLKARLVGSTHSLVFGRFSLLPSDSNRIMSLVDSLHNQEPTKGATRTLANRPAVALSDTYNMASAMITTPYAVSRPAQPLHLQNDRSLVLSLANGVSLHCSF